MDESVVKWLEYHRRLPLALRRTLDKRTSEDAAEIKTAKALARLRAKAKREGLPRDLKNGLDKVGARCSLQPTLMYKYLRGIR